MKQTKIQLFCLNDVRKQCSKFQNTYHVEDFALNSI